MQSLPVCHPIPALRGNSFKELNSLIQIHIGQHTQGVTRLEAPGVADMQDWIVIPSVT
jgi:hypothetical protein